MFLFNKKSFDFFLKTAFAFLLIFFISSYLFPPRPILPKEGSPPLFYANQNRDDLELVIKLALEEAKESIVLAIFGLSDECILKTLKKKSEEGVSVTIIYDSHASKGLRNKLGNKVHLFPRHEKGHMHLKILSIDKKISWIGSANMTWESLNMHDNLIIGIHSKQVACFIEEYLQTFTKKNSLQQEKYLQATVGGQTIQIYFLPEQTKTQQALIHLIHNAKKSLHIAMFTWTRKDFAQAIVQAKERGVQTESILDYHSGRGSSKHIVQYLHQKNVPVALNQGMQLLHHKLLCIDSNILVTGSANWTKSAFTQNDDCLIVINELNSKQKRVINTVWKVTSLESSEKMLILDSNPPSS